jgi:hypothetical protein
MASVVFDSYAILALLRDEPGAEVVAGYIDDGLISAVNLQEVIKALLLRPSFILRLKNLAAAWEIGPAWRLESPKDFRFLPPIRSGLRSRCRA